MYTSWREAVERELQWRKVRPYAGLTVEQDILFSLANMQSAPDPTPYLVRIVAACTERLEQLADTRTGQTTIF